MEHAELVTEPTGRYLRYMKAIPTGKVCLAFQNPETLFFLPFKNALYELSKVLHDAQPLN